MLAAVSGGSDSLLCALTLAEELPPLGATLSIAHVNHHMTAVADRDEEAVGRLAERLGVPFVALQLRDEELRQREGASSSVEARLREERLRLLRTEALQQNARAVALGHTASDAAETFLLMALRGSGPRGLGSMRPVRELPGGVLLLRPLMDMTRAEVIEELNRRGESYSSDPLNESDRYRRNRVRREVLPLLEELEPGAVRVLARTAARCAEESDLVEAQAAALFERAVLLREEGRLALDRGALAREPQALVKAVLRHAWRELRLEEDASPERQPLMLLPPQGVLVDDIAARIASSRGESARFDPSRGIVATVRGNEVLLEREAAPTLQADPAGRAILLPEGTAQWPVLNSAQRYTPADFEITLPGNQGALLIEIVPAAEFHPDYASEDFRTHRAAAIDARTIRKDLLLAPVDPEASVPLGGGRSKPARELLKDAGIPAADRTRVAALVDERGALWIPGVRRPATGYVTPRTQLVVLCRWRPAAQP